MKPTTILSSLLLVSSINFNCTPKIDYAKAEKYIKESESQWAESTANGDTAVVRRILADDFIGTSSDGTHYNKRDAIVETLSSSKVFIFNHLDSVKIRFFGNIAVAQGSETWRKKSGIILKGKFVWTDTWRFRNNIWQIVAAQDNTIKLE
ncbi:MAG TPA: nuclear transport factor 2 family protein [Chitinophagaceae bacterium]|nr:nuclear transport factor 2 family protein [Chitinophagaceae bacterium]